MKTKLTLLIPAAVLLLAACQPAASAVAPTLTPRPTAANAFRDLPSTMEGTGIAVVPGDYRFPRWFGIPLSVTIEDESWRVVTLERSELLALIQGENNVGFASRWLTFLPVYDGEAVSLFDEMLAAPNLELLAGPEARTVGKYQAFMAVLVALPNPDFAETDESPAGVQPLDAISEYAGNWTWLTSTPEAELMLIKMIIGDHTLLVYVEAPQGEFDSFSQQVDTVLSQLQPLE
jgi:hypothetical protein